mmetsp:Transcript_29481/g.80937  ORF Transcript_29481/g.80937 Transcript_29481/m.80937 type:complete len:333 (-) Transcript_29481:119-1117(-)|eukprot:CAMPEP_0179072088 /NCGR_PEP_ID=MMETSP0796-20121207/31873_1 /TAXON_ID=73915 /ORGANISM="Pyrodinium bahamense, Strain pbaha01" /LENGTH=332 /DNA_ID=CAMNT_0020769235 /DNA_START=33 /DNA_END=1031 /DNA_ORIENTATION=+
MTRSVVLALAVILAPCAPGAWVNRAPRRIAMKGTLQPGAAQRLLRVEGDGAAVCALPPNARWCKVCLQGLQAFDMAVYAAKDIVSDAICTSGSWEMANLSAFGPAGHALDVGGNIGYYTLGLAAAGWTVTSIEPLPGNVALMQASLCRNPELASRVQLLRLAVGAKNDRCTSASDPDNMGDGWIRCGEDAKHIPAGYTFRGQFDVERLDDVMQQQHISRVDLVKIDVEGWECQVFAGAKKLLSVYKPRMVQTEVWKSMVGCDPVEYLQMFKANAYEVTKDMRCQTPSTELQADIENFWMCREEPEPAAGKPAFVQFGEAVGARRILHLTRGS